MSSRAAATIAATAIGLMIGRHRSLAPEFGRHRSMFDRDAAACMRGYMRMSSALGVMSAAMMSAMGRSAGRRKRDQKQC
ncbi:MAG: hypothetical protein ACO1NY_00225 [Pseudorhodoplanes sp.]